MVFTAPVRRVTFALLATALVAAACTGSGDDDDDGATTATPSPTPTVTAVPGSITEVEPNEDPATATALPSGVTVSFDGVCTGADDLDWFAFDGPNGPVSLSIAWTEGDEPADIDLVVIDSAGTFELTDLTNPPGDSPAEVSGTITAAGTYFISIDCYNTTPNVFWQGTLTR